MFIEQLVKTPILPFQMMIHKPNNLEINSNYTSLEDHIHHLSKLSALFLLEIKEKHKLTQVAMQAIVGGITNLTQVNVTIDIYIYPYNYLCFHSCT